jgi:hypothetical protein
MNDQGMSILLQQIAWHAPAFLVLVVGLLVALVTFSRNPLPSILTMLACGLMMLSRLSVILLTYTVMRGERGDDTESMRTVLSVGNTALSAIALALLVAAVFVGRTNPASTNSERSY